MIPSLWCGRSDKMTLKSIVEKDLFNKSVYLARIAIEQRRAEASMAISSNWCLGKNSPHLS